MKFDELDKRMRVFETSHDLCAIPGIYMVARLDGRCFTRLTKEKHRFDVPYDPVFRDYMVETTRHLMDCGFRITYGHTQSDEISLLCHKDEEAFQRKLRKFNSILAGEASARFSLLSNALGTFDCRISQLPSINLVADYFRWRSEDAHRNALNAHCYWSLRKDGKTPAEANALLLKMPANLKNELLFRKGVNFNRLPDWQKRGVGLYWEKYEKRGYNPVTEESTIAVRNRLKVDFELPMKDRYSEFIETIITTSENSSKK